MSWLDSHCHINDEAFQDDLEDVLDRMLEANIQKAMIVSCNLKDYEVAKKIQKEGISFKRSLGLYPGDANTISLEELLPYYQEVDAIGEIGLDYHYGKDNKEKQIELFKKQCEIAEKLHKPVIIHSREAINDTYEILRKYKLKGVMHCYSDSKEMVKNFIKLGFYISFAGPVTWKNAVEPLKVIQVVPLDRILIETDCPYLSPVPMRGKRNEPANVIYTGSKIAEELGLSKDLFQYQINDNYDALFSGGNQ